MNFSLKNLIFNLFLSLVLFTPKINATKSIIPAVQRGNLSNEILSIIHPKEDSDFWLCDKNGETYEILKGYLPTEVWKKIFIMIVGKTLNVPHMRHNLETIDSKFSYQIPRYVSAERIIGITKYNEEEYIVDAQSIQDRLAGPIVILRFHNLNTGKSRLVKKLFNNNATHTVISSSGKFLAVAKNISSRDFTIARDHYEKNKATLSLFSINFMPDGITAFKTILTQPLYFELVSLDIKDDKKLILLYRKDSVLEPQKYILETVDLETKEITRILLPNNLTNPQLSLGGNFLFDAHIFTNDETNNITQCLIKIFNTKRGTLEKEIRIPIIIHSDYIFLSKDGMHIMFCNVYCRRVHNTEDGKLEYFFDNSSELTMPSENFGTIFSTKEETGKIWKIEDALKKLTTQKYTTPLTDAIVQEPQSALDFLRLMTSQDLTQYVISPESKKKLFKIYESLNYKTQNLLHNLNPSFINKLKTKPLVISDDACSSSEPITPRVSAFQRIRR